MVNELSWVVLVYFQYFRLSLKDKNLQTEAKHVVCMLFSFCHTCKEDNSEVEFRECGSNISVMSKCLVCKQESEWHSQPYLPGSKLFAGNFLLCLSLVLSGGSAGKVFKMFSHMGLGCVSLNTFFKHQRVCIQHFII